MRRLDVGAAHPTIQLRSLEAHRTPYAAGAELAALHGTPDSRAFHATVFSGLLIVEPGATLRGYRSLCRHCASSARCCLRMPSYQGTIQL